MVRETVKLAECLVVMSPWQIGTDRGRGVASVENSTWKCDFLEL